MVVFKKYQFFYGGVIVLLTLCIVLLFGILLQFHIDRKEFEFKNRHMATYLQMKTKKRDIIINKQMKKWLSIPQNTNRKYYKIIVKGYGSVGQNKGRIYPSLRVYCVEKHQFVIQHNILKYAGNKFCGNWQVLAITPQDYIQCKFKQQFR